MNIGDLVDVMTHTLPGKDWTINQVGAIIGPTHENFIDNRYTKDKSNAPVPPIKKSWWGVSVTNPSAKGGYAYVSLPEMYLGPHSCTVSCPEHELF